MRIKRPPAFLVAACGAIWLVFALVLVRTRDDATPPLSPEAVEQVLAIARTVENQAATARLAQQLAEITAALSALESTEPGCPDCGSLDEEIKRIDELKRKQAEARRRLEEARIQARRVPRVVMPRDCQVNPLAKGCW